MNSDKLSSQAVIAGMIIVAMSIIALGALVAAYWDHSFSGTALAICSTVVGAMATALNVPRSQDAALKSLAASSNGGSDANH